MIWVLLSMAVIILSIAVMVKGWDDLHGGMFHGGLIYHLVSSTLRQARHRNVEI